MKIFNEYQGESIKINGVCYRFAVETTSSVNSDPSEVEEAFASCLECALESSSSEGYSESSSENYSESSSSENYSESSSSSENYSESSSSSENYSESSSSSENYSESSSSSEDYSESSSSSENYSESSSSSEGNSSSSSMSIGGYCEILEDFNTDLVSYWNLDEASGDRADSIGANDFKENFATINSSSGKNNDGAFFPETKLDNHMLISPPNPPFTNGSQDFNPSSTVALSMWYKHDLINTTGDTGGRDGGDNWWLLFDHYFVTDSPRVQASITQSDVTTVSTAFYNFTEGVFHHFMLIADGTYVRLYIDGALQEKVLYDGTLRSSSTPTVNMGFGGLHTDRVYDEIAVWKSPTFASEEEANILAEALYNNGVGAFWSDSIGNWDICEAFMSSSSSSSSEDFSESSSEDFSESSSSENYSESSSEDYSESSSEGHSESSSSEGHSESSNSSENYSESSSSSSG